MRKFVFMMSILIVVVLAGCVPEENIDATVENGGAYEREVNANKSNNEEVSEGENDELDEDEQDKDEQAEEKLKIISKYEYKVETVDFDNDLDKVIQKVHNSGGYVRSSNIKVDKQSMSSRKSAEVVLRVPKDEVVEVIQFLKDTVSVESETVNSVDITDDYYDMEERLENLIIRENRLIDLYKNTTEISEIIEIDDKLFEIEELKKEELRKKSKVDDRIVFSRIEVHLEEVGKLSSEPDTQRTPKEKLSNALSTTGENIKNFVVGTFVILIKYSPLFLIAIIGLYAYKRFVYDRAEPKGNNDEKDKMK